MAQILNKSNRRRSLGPGKTAYFRGKELYFEGRYEQSYDTLKKSYLIKITASGSYFIGLTLLAMNSTPANRDAWRYFRIASIIKPKVVIYHWMYARCIKYRNKPSKQIETQINVLMDFKSASPQLKHWATYSSKVLWMHWQTECIAAYEKAVWTANLCREYTDIARKNHWDHTVREISLECAQYLEAKRKHVKACLFYFLHSVREWNRFEKRYSGIMDVEKNEKEIKYVLWKLQIMYVKRWCGEQEKINGFILPKVLLDLIMMYRIESQYIKMTPYNILCNHNIWLCSTN